MALLVTFPAPRLVASRLLGARSLRTVGGGRHHTAFGLHARASAADKQDTKAQQDQQEADRQMNEQKPRASTQFRRLGPLARGTALSNLGGSSPMNLFGFLEQLSDAMETDLAAMAGVPFGHKDSVGAFPNHLAFPYDIVDKRSEYVITADIPGANRDMVEVSVDEDRVLHIVDERADRHEERGGSDEDGAKYVVYNRSFGRFERNFQLPQDVEDGAVDATMKHGVLVVRLPKKKETIRQEQRKNARRIAVKG